MVPILLYIVLTYFVYSAECSVSCSFDAGLCGWHGVGKSSFQWKNYSGPSPDRTSGPLNDHTCNNYKGQYVFITGDDVRSKDESAALESETVAIDKPTEFGFWISMNGIGVGNLSLVIRSLDEKEAILWSAAGRQGERWLYISVKLEPGNFTLRFEATVRLPYASDLAIDDIRLISEDYNVNSSHCNLPPTTTTTTQSTTVSTRSLTTEAVDVTTSKPATEAPSVMPLPQTCTSLSPDVVELPGSCSFDKNTCGNKIIPSKENWETSWVRINKPNGYADKKIASDHSGSGYFMHFVTSRGFFFSNPQYIANMETPDINSPDVCLTFWYNTPSTYSNLRVYVAGHGVHHRQVWVRDTEVKEKFMGWHKASFTIHEETPFKIIFATMNNHGLAQVGIDDISILGNPTFSTKPSQQSVSTLVSTNMTSAKLLTTTSTKNPSTTDNSTMTPTNIVSTTSSLKTSPLSANSTLTPTNIVSTIISPKTSTITAYSTMTSANIVSTVNSLKTSTITANTTMTPTHIVTTASSPKTSPVIAKSTKTLTNVTHTSPPSGLSTNEVTHFSTVSISKKPKPIDNHKSVSSKSTGNGSDLAIAAGVTVSVTACLILLVMATIYTYLRMKRKLANSKEKTKIKQSALNGVLIKGNEMGVISNGQTHIVSDNNNISPHKQIMNGNLTNGYTPSNGHLHNGSYVSPADDVDESTRF